MRKFIPKILYKNLNEKAKKVANKNMIEFELDKIKNLDWKKIM